MIVPSLPTACYELKARRWQQLWSELRVEPCAGGSAG